MLQRARSQARGLIGGGNVFAGSVAGGYGRTVPDAIFAHPRLAQLYDAFDGPRDDLPAYVRVTSELGAQRVLDVGCGTGSLAILLAATGRAVIAAEVWAAGAPAWSRGEVPTVGGRGRPAWPGRLATGAAIFPGEPVFEPDSDGLFVLLVVAFAALMGGVIVARHLVVRVLAALLAFVPAVLFGVACVNKYYGYYETWGAVAADFSDSGTASNLPAIPSIPPGPGTASQPVPGPSGEAPPGRRPSLPPAATDGITVRMQVPGRLSGISRQVLVFLPGQYFQPGYARHRFPVIELLHGSPGQPQDWITVLVLQG
jgi:hypothetical protein